MSEREYSAEVSRRLDAHPALIWALVADTNRFDRASGLVPANYRWEELVPGDPSTRAHVAHAVQLGIPLRWIEPPYQWIEAHSVRGQRRFLSGPVDKGGFTVELRAENGATVVTARAWVQPKGMLGSVVGLYQQTQFRGALTKYLDAIEAVLERTKARAKDYRPELEPPAAMARRLLLDTQSNQVTSGPSTPLNEGEMTFRAQRFERAPVDGAVRARLLVHLRERPDEELGQMRPFELARAWNLPAREVLRGFLYAAKAGLVDLYWLLNCPSCRVGSEQIDSLSKVGMQGHCEACDIRYDLDFARHIEAVFKVNQALRPVEVGLYCESSPWWKPHVFAQLELEPNEERSTRVRLPRGPMLVRALRGTARGTIDINTPPPARLRVVIDEENVEFSTDGAPSTDEHTQLELVHRARTRTVLLVERVGWNAEAALGSVLATLPDFLDLFAAEAPASGVELSVGSMTVLFSDLTGSTAMYERLGDARAFALVQEHFRLMEDATRKHRGAIVKTMGDAVMASFNSPADALRCAFEMVERTEATHKSAGLEVKLGVHEGPCLVVRANERLDYFGTTVNVAARLQAQAHGSEVVVMHTLLSHPDVQALVGEKKPAERLFSAHLKGIKEEQRLVGLHVGT